MNNQKITHLANATSATDALNLQTADSRYYANTVTLNNITAPTNDVSLNSYKITNLATPTASNDVCTKAYVDDLVDSRNPESIINTTNADSKLVANQTEITNGSTPLNMNSQKITNLANATSATDALNR